MPTGISPGGRPIDESPLSASKTDNWVARNGGLPPYVRGIARGIAKKHGGTVTSSDISMAWAFVKKLAGTSKNPAVKAAAAKALAQEIALRARAHAHTDLARYSGKTIDLDWSSFDSARGTKPKQPKAAAQPQNTGAVAGYTGPPLDPSTINAIRQFQQENGLPVTGNLDEATASAALNAPAKAAAAAAATKASKAAASASKKAASATASAEKKSASEAEAAQKSTAKAKVNSIKVQLAKATAAKNTTQISALKVKLAQAQADYSNI